MSECVILPLFNSHPHWPVVKKVLTRLHGGGFRAYLAGGCVRDGLLGRSPKDFDIATSAKPQQVLNLFPRGKKQGKVFGVIALHFSSPVCRVEVATFRKDGPYQDGRRPEFVTFSSEKEDALRRDFTVNALFYDLQKQKVLDYVEGVRDLKACLLRTVGQPVKRFQEDKLRLIRAVRLSLQLKFQIEAATLQTLLQMRESLQAVAPQRVYEESFKILTLVPAPCAFEAFKKLALLTPFWNFLSPQHLLWCENFWKHIDSKAFEKKKPDPCWLWLPLLYPFLILHRERFFTPRGQWHGEYEKRLRTFMFPLRVIRFLRQVVQASAGLLDKVPCRWGQKLLLLNEDFSPAAFKMSEVFLKTQHLSPAPLKDLQKAFQTRCEKGTRHLPPPLLTGEDLKRMSLKPGPRMALQLKKAYEYQVTHHIRNKTELKKKLFSPASGGGFFGDKTDTDR